MITLLLDERGIDEVRAALTARVDMLLDRGAELQRAGSSERDRRANQESLEVTAGIARQVPDLVRT